MLRGKTGKTFLVQFARPNSAIWIEKSHYNSRVSLHEAPTKNVSSRRPILGLKTVLNILKSVFGQH